VRPNGGRRFGRFGGQYVPETLLKKKICPALAELEAASSRRLGRPASTARPDHLLRTYVGRPTQL